MQTERLPYLDDVRHSRVDEAIWGHRLREDQTAWLLALEMLNVAEACLRTGDVLADMGVSNAPDLKPRLRIRFRQLLFRLNQKAAELAASVQAGGLTSEKAWGLWLAYASAEYDGPGAARYHSLRDRFDDFLQFERAIDLVRSTAIDGLEGKKGIYNRFIFPMAPEALYWETGMKKVGDQARPDPTANTFTRAGTLLHIMLARSSSANLLRIKLEQFLQRDSQARRLVRQLQVDEPSDERDSPKTYLPYKTHRRYDRLGEDYASILSLQAPENDKLLWLVPIAALHVAIYHAEVARELLLNKAVPILMVCEIVEPRKSIVRESSIESFTENSDFARQAVAKYLKIVFEAAEWCEIVSGNDIPDIERARRAREYIDATLRPPPSVLDEPQDGDKPGALREKVVKFFYDRHLREFSKVHSTYGREAGLVSKRATNRYRYAPTDQLLQCLVLANVAGEMSFEAFLDLLLDRYGLIVGPRQQKAVEDFGYQELGKTISSGAFRRNQLRLEMRLRSMGMLRRLSDSQAYVLNPLQSRD